MYESLNNQVIETVKETYLNQLKNKYTRFLRLTSHNILEHLTDGYGKIITVDIESNNKKINYPINLSLMINKLFSQINSCVQLF